MEIKKNSNKEISHLRFSFFQIGMIVALSAVLFAFNYTSFSKVELPSDPMVYVEDLEIINATIQTVKVPPPPKENIIRDIISEVVSTPYEKPEIIFSETDISQEFGEEIDFPEEQIEETFEVFDFHEVSEMAQFKDGVDAMYRFIKLNLVYPAQAFRYDVTGKVVVQFVVMPDGSIQDIEVLSTRKLGYGCEEAAIDCVKKMNGLWLPAKQRDKKVPVRFQLPIVFSIGS